MGGATPEEEIIRQHEQAIAMIASECAPSIDHGEIPLHQKQVPLEDLQERDQMICVSSRGQVDISALQALVREGYNQPLVTTKTTKTTKTPSTTTPTIPNATHLWDDTHAATTNVRITRASHDAWGIKKIVLVFSDDFVQDVYELPWWHAQPQIRDAIQPILTVLNIAPTRIVRLLLAALPPGVTIPIHHDSGEWVKQTHRIHVPVIVTDPTKILFTCGPTSNNMQRVNCIPGHVFEMNNQAKHAVSNCGTDHRVHLIMDYVDDVPRVPNIQLAPGERLIQTRRSVDRLSDKGRRPTPSYMILGAQKAGTTSLYEYMVQHPLVIRAQRRETHCLDWRWNNFTPNVTQQRDHCLNFYKTKELQLAPSCLTGDSTPSYLLDSRRVIPRLLRIWTHNIQFIVILRDPVPRAHSHYCMVTSPDGTNEQKLTRGSEWKGKTLMETILLDMRKLKSCGLIPYWNIDEGIMDQSIFDSFVGTIQEDEAWDAYMKDIPINTGSHSLISRGMYELQLRSWYRAFDRKRFLLIKLEDWKDEGVLPTMNRVWAHLGLPPYPVNDAEAKNTRSYDTMDEHIKTYLRAFYAPHNRKLNTLLQSTHDKWNDPWSNDS